MKTVVKMFQKRFANLVKLRIKRQTVRRVPKRARDMPEVGDVFSGREWTGAPYRSKQAPLCEGTITAVDTIRIEERCIIMDGAADPIGGVDSFAMADGFKDFEDLVQWFKENHKLPFTGILIKWDPDFEP